MVPFKRISSKKILSFLLVYLLGSYLFGIGQELMNLKMVQTYNKKEKVSLNDIFEKEKPKALLLDFWASWCKACQASLSHIKQYADALRPQGVIIVGMNIDNKSKAEAIRQEHNINTPWLRVPASRPFKGALSLSKIPHVVLITPNGDVLFQGHPADPELKGVLMQHFNVKL